VAPLLRAGRRGGGLGSRRGGVLHGRRRCREPHGADAAACNTTSRGPSSSRCLLSFLLEASEAFTTDIQKSVNTGL